MFVCTIHEYCSMTSKMLVAVIDSCLHVVQHTLANRISNGGRGRGKGKLVYHLGMRAPSSAGVQDTSMYFWLYCDIGFVTYDPSIYQI